MPVAGYEPPEDPADEPTRMGDYGGAGNDYSECRQPAASPPDPPESPTPWYLRPTALVGWGAVTAILIAVLVWGIVRLSSGTAHQTTSPTTSPATTTTPGSSATTAAPAAPPAATTDTTAATTTEPPASTTTSTEPPATETASPEAPTTPTATPGEAFQLPQLPSEITVPGLPTIQLPPGR